MATLLVLFLAVGCVRTPPSPATDSLPPADRTAAVQRMLDELTAAAARNDRPGFDRATSTQDPGFAGRPDVWFANLRRLGPDLRLRAGASEATPGVGVRTRFADRAWLQQVTATWRPPGNARTAEARIWLTVVAENGRAVLVGDTDAPAADRSAPRPLWLQAAVALDRRGPVTVIGPDPRPARSWLTRAVAAATAVRGRLPTWDGSLVVELPATRQSFERSIGVADGSYARIAAVAWPRGAKAGTAAVHIVVNPAAAAGLSAEGLAVLLTHEVVHVATRSFASAAPTWLVEGFADQIAYEVHPSSRSAALGPLRDAVRRGWLPRELPPESAFAASAADLDLGYAQAWSLCTLLADSHGATGLARFYATVSAGTPLADALADLGTSESALVREWRDSMRRLR